MSETKEEIATPNPAVHQKKISILIIDPDPDESEVLRTWFVCDGHRVAITKDGCEGLTRAILDQPSIILIDPMLNDCDGFQLIEDFKKNQAIKNIPLLMVTRLGQKNDIIRAVKLGISDYVVKPYDLDVITQKVSEKVSGQK